MARISVGLGMVCYPDVFVMFHISLAQGRAEQAVLIGCDSVAFSRAGSEAATSRRFPCVGAY